MKATFAIIGAIALLALFGIVSALTPDRIPSYEEIENARRWSNIVFYGAAILIIGIPVLLLAVGGAAAWRFFRRPVIVRPDTAGRLPALLTNDNRDQYFALSAAALLEGYHTTQRTAAAIAPVPTSYAPHYSTSYAPHTANTHAGGSAQLTVSDAAASLEAETVLTLPDSVLLADYIAQIKPHCLAFGIDTNGRLLQAPLSQSYHLLSSGRTRSGKSNSLNLILAQLHYQQRHHGLQASISVLDYKRELSAIWSRSSLVELATTEPVDMVDLLRDMVHGSDGLLARQDLFAREGARLGRVFGNLVAYEAGTGQRLKRHFIAIDELNAVLIAADDKSLADELAKLLYLGAGAGFFIIGGAHQLDASTFKRAAKEQFSSRMQFGAFDQSTVNLMYGSIRIDEPEVQLLDGRSGRGLIQLVAQNRPTPFQALEVTEGDLLPFIDQKPDSAQQKVIHQLADDAATIINAPSQGDAPIHDAVRRAIWRKKKAKVNKAETIWQLWTVRKGAGDTYQQASALYDRVIADGEPAGL